MRAHLRSAFLPALAFCLVAVEGLAGGPGPKGSDAFLNDPKFKKALPPANWQVLRFCFDNRGKQVGDGECAALAVKALHLARAKRQPPYGLDADYVWGELVGSATPGKTDMSKVKLGDILQIRNAKIVERFPGGFRASVTPHHTAVVVGLSNGGKTVTVLHQNVGDPGTPPAKKKIVQAGYFALAGLQAGWVKAYRPMPLPEPVDTKFAYDDPVAVEVYRLINAERTTRGLKLLQLNPQAGAAAMAMAKKKEDRVQLRGEDVAEALQMTGYLDERSTMVSVNATAPNAKVCVQTWMQSEFAQKLVLSPDYVDAGVYVLRGERSVICCLILAKPQ